jgi:hypothetical protein
VGDFGGQDAVKAEARRSLNELMNGEERGESGETVRGGASAGECGDADAGEDCAAGKN